MSQFLELIELLKKHGMHENICAYLDNISNDCDVCGIKTVIPFLNKNEGWEDGQEYTCECGIKYMYSADAEHQDDYWRQCD